MKLVSLSRISGDRDVVDDDGHVFVVADVDDLQHVHIAEVGAGFRAVVVEHYQVVAADVVDVFLPFFPVQGQQVGDDIQKAGDKAAVAFVAQGVDDLYGGVGFAGAADAEQEQAFPPGPEFREVLCVVFGVAGDDRAAPVVVGKIPLVHVGSGDIVEAVQGRLRTTTLDVVED